MAVVAKMKSIITKSMSISYIEKDILLARIIAYSDIDVEEVKENYEATMEITCGRRYAVLIDAKVVVNITGEARALGAKKEYQENLIAQAIVVNSLPNRLVGNFIVKFNKPYAPTKVFSNDEDALEWLREKIRKDR